MPSWQCGQCGKVIKGSRKALRQAKKVPCSKSHKVEVIRVNSA